MKSDKPAGGGGADYFYAHGPTPTSSSLVPNPSEVEGWAGNETTRVAGVHSGGDCTIVSLHEAEKRS